MKFHQTDKTQKQPSATFNQKNCDFNNTNKNTSAWTTLALVWQKQSDVHNLYVYLGECFYHQLYQPMMRRLLMQKLTADKCCSAVPQITGTRTSNLWAWNHHDVDWDWNEFIAASRVQTQFHSASRVNCVSGLLWNNFAALKFRLENVRSCFFFARTIRFSFWGGFQLLVWSALSKCAQQKEILWTPQLKIAIALLETLKIFSNRQQNELRTLWCTGIRAGFAPSIRSLRRHSSNFRSISADTVHLLDPPLLSLKHLEYIFEYHNQENLCSQKFFVCALFCCMISKYQARIFPSSKRFLKSHRISTLSQRITRPYPPPSPGQFCWQMRKPHGDPWEGGSTTMTGACLHMLWSLRLFAPRGQEGENAGLKREDSWRSEPKGAVN